MPITPLAAHDVHDLPGDAPRRRHLVILFSDLCESTRFAARLEAEDYSDLLARLRAAYHEIVPRHGGTVAQISGDGMLALFGYPEAREGDGRRAVEAALDLHRAVADIAGGGGGGAPDMPPLRLHSGIHSGLVLLHQGDRCRGRFELLGCATNIASRLCATAGPGEILVSEATLGPERHRFDVAARRRLTLRGADTPLPTLAIAGRTETPVVERAPLVGRAAELELMRSRLAEAAAGTPRFAVVEGPPGVGKTRLAEELLGEARANGFSVHRAECDPAAGPLHPFLEIARSIAGGSAGGSAGGGAGGSAGGGAGGSAGGGAGGRAGRSASEVEPLPDGPAALAKLIDRAADEGPILLLIDDWHAADDASREAMALLRNAGARPMMVVATARFDPLRAGLCTGAERLSLAPFTPRETARAVAGLLPSADPFAVQEIVAATGGNALFIEEMCHALAAGGQGGIPQAGTPWLANLIESRLARLAPEAARLVRIAAVIGNVIPCRLLETISGRGGGDPLVRALAEQDFVFPGERPDMLRFKHGITREVIRESVGLHERRALHGRIAEALRAYAADGGEEEPVEALAYHCDAAGATEETIEYGERAGDRALSASALDRAQSYYRIALDALERLPPSAATAARFDRIARNFGLAGIFDPARDQLPIFERAAARARERRDGESLAWAEYWLGYINYGLGEPESAIAHCNRALEAALGGTDGRLIVQIRATLGQAMAASGDYRGALLLLDEAIEVKRRHRTGRHASVGFAYSLGSKAFVLADMGRFAEAEAGFEEAMEVVRGAQHEVEGSVLCQRAAMCLWQGRWNEAARFASDAEAVAVRVHSVYLCAMSRAIGAYARWSHAQDPAEIAALIEATSWLEAKGRGLFISLAYGWLSNALIATGDLAGGRRYAARALRRGRKGDRLGEAMAWRALAAACARGARGRSADECLARAAAAASARDSAHEAALNRLLAAAIGPAPSN